MQTRTLPSRPDGEAATRTLARDAPEATQTTQPDPRMVFAKTIAGTEAVRASTQRLSLPARRLLMLLDGRRSLSQLPSIVRPDEVPTLLRELEAQGMITLTGMIESDGSASGVHPDIKMARIKRALSGVFERELGSAGERAGSAGCRTASTC